MNGSHSGITSFGPFRLSPAKREIARDGVPLALGDRALDILIALVDRAGETISHRDLIARVWRDVVVSPGNLRVHMSALRKALGDGEDGARYIENVTGQGYCFVAPVSRADLAQTTIAASSPSPLAPIPQSRALPPALTRMVGRDDTVRTIAADLRIDRFVTIVGPGGMGKTTVAVSVAHAMLEEFAGRVCFVDIGAITDAKLLAATVASTLGLTIPSADALPTLMAFLRTMRILLVLDNCEHVIDAAASLAETIFNQTPEVHILATSREALRVEGEHAHWLRPLASPPPNASLPAAEAMTFPAVKLFVERATAKDHRFELTDSNAAIVADICGRLDGIALAIEFVAGRISTYGLEGTADLLSKRLGLHWQGRRTALPRHQTLHALLDWSYSLLTESERRVLRRLSIFVGPFTLEAAQAVASAADLDQMHLADAVDQLVAKSLVSVINTHDGATCYRLLETTRIYAIRQLEAGGEVDATAERHARYFIRLLNAVADGRFDDCPEDPAPTRHEHLGNLRAALEWCFGERDGMPAPGNIELGIDLAAASAPAFLDLSLWSECHKWSEAALARLQDSTRDDQRELVLQETLAMSMMATRTSDVRMPIVRGLEIAQRLGETAARLRLLAGLHASLIRTADFKGLPAVAEEMAAMARTTKDVPSLIMSDWLRGSAQHFLGHQTTAKQLLESGFARDGARQVRFARQFGFDYRVRALVTLARVLWLSGHPHRALQTAREAIEAAAGTAKPLNVCFSFVYTSQVFLWCGDLNTAQDVIQRLLGHPHWQVLEGFHAEGLALKGALLVHRGNIEDGAELLHRALKDMRAQGHSPLTTLTACCLTDGLVKAGRIEEARAVIDDAIAHAPGGAEALEAPELLRVRAGLLLSMSPPDEAEAESCLMQSLACARHQGAKGWELRTTVTLTKLRAMQGRAAEARDALSTIYHQFTEGFETPDLEAAAELLRQLETATSLASKSTPTSSRRSPHDP